MSKWRNPTILIGLFTLIGSSFCFDCFDVCFHNYTTSSDNELNCELLLNARTCYNANVENCSSYQSRATLHQVQLALDNNGCSIATSSVTTPTMTTMTDDTTSMISCPSVNTQSATLLVTNAVIWSEETVPSSCMVMESDLHLQHCSIFLDGHLRPFRSYHDGLQTCSIPGSWKLFQHPQLVVEVEGNSSGHAHTQLTKVSVTLFLANCSKWRSWRYVAESKQSLPMTFSGEPSPYVNGNSALQLHLGSDGSVVTILATWMNTTIVIRRLAELLSVTLQVPGQMSFDSEGLCVGCPRHQLLDTLSEIQRTSNNCRAVHTRVLLECFSVINIRSLGVVNISYYEACTYSYLKTSSAYITNMMNAVGKDATMLTNEGFVPRRPHTDAPPILPSSPGSTESTSAMNPTPKTTSVSQTSRPSETVSDMKMNTGDIIQISINFSSTKALDHSSLVCVFTTIFVLYFS